MSERFKYSTNGVYRCENFAQNLVENTPPLQLAADGGIDEWFILLDEEPIDNETLVYPFIGCFNNPQLYVNCFFNILGKDGKSFQKTLQNGLHLIETEGPRGKGINILDVLNENNGYLDNGALVVEYGLQVVSVLGRNGIWQFNLNEEFFNSKDSLTIEYGSSEDGSPKILYGHKQLLRFHSPLFQDQVTKFSTRWTEMIEDCLQMAHGVRIPIYDNIIKVAIIAHRNKLRNVVQYVDQQLVQVNWRADKKLDESDIWLFLNCINMGLRHFLAHLLNHSECFENLKDIIKKLNIKRMPGETMKMFAAKIFKLGT